MYTDHIINIIYIHNHRTASMNPIDNIDIRFLITNQILHFNGNYIFFLNVKYIIYSRSYFVRVYFVSFVASSYSLFGFLRCVFLHFSCVNFDFANIYLPNRRVYTFDLFTKRAFVFVVFSFFACTRMCVARLFSINPHVKVPLNFAFPDQEWICAANCSASRFIHL